MLVKRRSTQYLDPDGDVSSKTNAVPNAGSVELRNSLTAQLGVELSSTVTFDYPTIPTLASYIASLMPGTGDESPNDVAGLGARAVAGPAVDMADVRLVILHRCERGSQLHIA